MTSYPVCPQHPPEEETLATCELLPALERQDGLPGRNSLYHKNLADPFALSRLCPNGSSEPPSQSSPTSRTLGSRTPKSKRTTDASPSPGRGAKKARRGAAERPPLVQHNAEKRQKESANVSTILQRHQKSTVCVCWIKNDPSLASGLRPSSPVEFLLPVDSHLSFILSFKAPPVQNHACESWNKCN